MEPLFPRWIDSAVGVAVGSAVALGAGVPVAAMAYVRSPWVTAVGRGIEQPVAFDHRHHVRDDGIGCLYCHFDAERSRYAGVPPTSLCMGCHGQIHADSPLLAPVRDSARLEQPIQWRRVYAVPDFVAFDHGSHVHRDVGCAECHGDVGSMAQVEKVSPLTMQWCLDCHRERGATTSCSGCHR